MDRIKINIWQLSVRDKVRWAGAITQAIARDDSPTQAGDLSEAVNTATANLNAAFQEAMNSRKEALDKAERLIEMEERWNRLMTEAVQRLRAEVNDEAERMAVTGFSLDASWRPEAVIDLAVSAGDTYGTLDVMFDPIRAAEVYEVQITLAPDQQSWTFKAISISSKVTLSSLPAGRRCWVRVRAVGPMGIGPWSEPVSKIVP